MENQAYIFFVYILNGFLIALLFDIFRIFRKSFKTKDLITYLEDIIFWILTCSILLYSIFKFNNGELRGYIFIGIIFGILIYTLTFSKIFIKTNLYIIGLIKKIILNILIKPIINIIKVLKRFIYKPLLFIFKNLKKFLSKYKNKIINLIKKRKKNEYKKDFV